jgi:hypothetical protein
MGTNQSYDQGHKPWYERARSNELVPKDDTARVNEDAGSLSKRLSQHRDGQPQSGDRRGK